MIAPIRMPPKPAPPFDGWPIHQYDASCGFVWWAAPAVFVSQATVDRGTLAGARFIQTLLDDALLHRAAEIREAGGVFVFHDWRSVRGYDADARQFYLGRMRARPTGYLRHSVVVVPANPLLRMAVQMGNLAASLTARAQVELASDPASALVKHRVSAPPAGSRYPGRK